MRRLIEKIYKSLLNYFYYNKYEKDLQKSKTKAYEFTRIICFLAVTIPVCLVLVFGYDTYREYAENKGLVATLVQYAIVLVMFFVSSRFFKKKMEVDFDSIAVGGCNESKSGVRCLAIGAFGFFTLNASLVLVLEYIIQ